MYSNLLQSYQGSVNVIVRGAAGSSAGITEIRNTMRAVDPTLPVHTLRTMRERIGTALLLPQYVAGLFGAFGLLGAALAIVGLYGVISYSVSQRTQEMGIRMALGGTRNDVLRLVLAEGMKLTAKGIVLGVLIAAASSRLLSTILYGVGAMDAVTFLGVSSMMILVTLIACYIPARRATRVDPMIALRQL
jgi:ABC-type antimicrobial peptide transport system permease subunit